ncbi:MGMT family protein [Rhodobiaceae bacterium]|nr:MGMT family protein [Rhodobiaceae bacterium]|tara:strand:+ start:3708 stop:3980 length:273 start_codon:yes stop_codon:yes gene_type:complete
MKLTGTDFQIMVWKEIKKIPKGKVRTYKEIAVAISRPKASRAVANACGKNPFPLKIPCHRVIGSNGYIGGYSGEGGIKKKIELLKLEKAL